MDPKGSEAYFDAVLAESVGLDYCMASHCLFWAFFNIFFSTNNYFQIESISKSKNAYIYDL